MNADSGPLSLRPSRIGDTKARQRDGRKFVVITQVGNRRLGLVVDRLFGQQDIVIKALGRSLKSVKGFAGATELGDQRVALVLDIAALVDEAFAVGDRSKMMEARR